MTKGFAEKHYSSSSTYKGPKRDKGDSEPAGPKGDVGSKEDVGPRGVKGDTGPMGDAGATGAKGDTGPAGPIGDAGDTGLAGSKGEKGDTSLRGPQGPNGDRGAKGPKGDDGAASKIARVNDDLSMNNHRITQMAASQWKSDAVNKEYVDNLPRGFTRVTADNLYLCLGGGTLHGRVHFLNASKITNLGAPQNPTDTATKKYVDSKVTGKGITKATADSRYLSLVGGNLRGDINMGGDKETNVSNLMDGGNCTSKSYVNSRFGLMRLKSEKISYSDLGNFLKGLIHARMILKVKGNPDSHTTTICDSSVV